MKASEFLKANYSELTEAARNIIETSDQSFDDWAGEFETVDDFNDFAEEVEKFIAENSASADAEAEQLAEKIRENQEWNLDACRNLCDMAGILEEWEQADGETFETVVEKAAEILKVDIY